MNILEIRQVTKQYAAHRALDGVSLNVPEGAIFGLLGPNGAGKTSLIRIINQITAPDEGEIYFQGEKLAPHHIARIGYLPEERGLYTKMAVGEQLIYLARLKGMSRALAVERLRQWFERFEMKGWWKKQVSDLSKGMQQKVQFIATVLHEPPLIILDEPFTGFDPVNANLIKDEILRMRTEGSTIIFSTHRMESVEELCDQIALIHQSKKVLEGTKAELRARYRANTYLIEGEGTLGRLPFPYERLAYEEKPDGHFMATLRAPGESSANGLLRALLDGGVALHSVRERIPSINDIFIAVVQGREAQLTLPIEQL